MTQPTRRSIAGFLRRLLDDPQLVDVIQRLDARALTHLIQHVGLEDAGEIVAFASAEQLERVFDEDLWRSPAPGAAERFDPARFSLWLEVMLEMGAERVAEILAGMDEEFVTMAISQEVLVLDADVLLQRRLGRGAEGGGWGPEDDLLENALESSVCFELDRYLLIGTGRDSWDAILAVLVALDSGEHELLVRILDRCLHDAAERIDDAGGLYDVLRSAEQLQSDVAFAREQRREREGFVPPQAAASFLALARTDVVGDDPITRDHFWNLQHGAAGSSARILPSDGDPGFSDPVMALLREARVLTPSEPAALLSAGELRSAQGSYVRAGAVALRSSDPALFAQRLGELGYLANVLLSGCHFRDRSFRPSEATQAALATCDLGLALLCADGSGTESAGRLLARHSLVAAFGVGWRVLQQDVVIAVARSLLETLSGRLARPYRPAEGEKRWDSPPIAALQRVLLRDLAAERPWRSRGKLGALAPVLAEGTLATLRDLFDECPTFEGRFLSTREALAQVEAFRRGMPGWS
jgi:hypothetical protein